MLIAPKTEGPYLHAKFYWFEGPDGNCAVVGSANCSAAAWLHSPSNGGNVEAVFVYDEASEPTFARVFARFPLGRHDPKEVPGLGTYVSQPAEAHQQDVAYELTDLILYRGRNEIEAKVIPGVPPDAHIVLRVNNEEIPLRRLENSASLLVGPRPDSCDSFGTMFGVVVIRLPHIEYVTAARWVDDEESLRHTARERPLETVLGNLRNASTPAEKSQVLADVELITKSLLGEPGAYPDVPAVRSRPNKEGESDAPSIKPGDLIRTLADLDAQSDSRGSAAGSETNLSLRGVMRALFGMLEEPDETPDGDDSEELADDDEGPQRKKPDRSASKPSSASEPRQASSITDNDRSKLQKKIADFHAKLLDDKFVQRCTATQLVHAVAFPLACAAMGCSTGWLSAREARDWVLRSTDLLFRVKTTSGQIGLLEAVKIRYEAEERTETFNHVVGNGELWLALIGAVSRVDWNQHAAPIERALTIREIVNAKDLIARANPERLGLLASRLKLMNSGEAVMAKAATTVRIITEMEDFLSKWFDLLIQKQEGGKHVSGDLAWRKSGWGIVRTGAPIAKGQKLAVYWRSEGQEKPMMAQGFFVNVRLAVASWEDLARLDRELNALGGR